MKKVTELLKRGRLCISKTLVVLPCSKFSGIQRHQASPVSQLHVSGELVSADGIPQDKNNSEVYSYNQSVLWQQTHTQTSGGQKEYVV